VESRTLIRGVNGRKVVLLFNGRGAIKFRRKTAN